MIGTFHLFTIRTVACTLLFFFLSSLIWCGDAECLSGDSDENCSALICSLIGTHCEETGNASPVDCSCVCHVPVVVVDLNPMIVLEQNGSLEPVFSSPLCDISTRVFHPPITA